MVENLRRIVPIKGDKINAIKSRQAFFGSNPKIAVTRLQDRIDRILRQALIGFPRLVFVLWLSLREEAESEKYNKKNWINANSHKGTVRGAVATWQLVVVTRSLPPLYRNSLPL